MANCVQNEGDNCESQNLSFAEKSSVIEWEVISQMKAKILWAKDSTPPALYGRH